MKTKLKDFLNESILDELEHRDIVDYDDDFHSNYSYHKKYWKEILKNGTTIEDKINFIVSQLNVYADGGSVKFNRDNYLIEDGGYYDLLDKKMSASFDNNILKINASEQTGNFEGNSVMFKDILLEIPLHRITKIEIFDERKKIDEIISHIFTDNNLEIEIKLKLY